MAKTEVFIAYSAILFIFPLGLFLLLILQILSDSYSNTQKKQSSDKQTRVRLYLVYISGMCCAVIGYSLHSTINTDWCETYGFLPCFVCLGLSKAALYLFFLRRAELAQGLNQTKCKTIFFKYIGPFYLTIYWLLYCILTTVVFSGKLVSHENQVSNCVFAKGSWWFSVFAGCIDIFNAIGSLMLFIYPLFMTIRQIKEINLTNRHLNDNESEYNHDVDYVEYVLLMKWNIVLTTIAASSSVISVFLFYITQEYVWLFCLGDPFVNALCTFGMIAPNRVFIYTNFKKCTCSKKKATPKIIPKDSRSNT